MPFDKISPSQMRIMRILTAFQFMALGGAIAFLAGSWLFDPIDGTTRFTGATVPIFYFATLNFGVFLFSAGMMLLELVTAPPFKVAINVPFVAGNFQTALSLGMIGAALSLQHAMLGGDASGQATLLQWLVLVGFGMNFFFVVMTKLHWNFTENTGKALPKA